MAVASGPSAAAEGAEYREVWFDVDLEECLRRNGERPDPVPDDVLRAPLRWSA